MNLWVGRLFGALIGMSLELSFASQVVQLPEETDVISMPVGCETGLEECAVRIRAGRRWSVRDGEKRKLMLGPSANVFFKSPQRLRLFSGSLWILPTDQTAHIETVMGDIAVQGEAWISGGADEVQVINLGGHVTMFATAAREKIAVPEGMKNRLSGVSGGQARIGIPQMAMPSEIMTSLSPIFWGTRNQFREWVGEHKEIWAGLEETVAGLHVELAEREVASQNAVIERERAMARARAEERKQLRKMFFQKTFGVE